MCQPVAEARQIARDEARERPRGRDLVVGHEAGRHLQRQDREHREHRQRAQRRRGRSGDRGGRGRAGRRRASPARRRRPRSATSARRRSPRAEPEQQQREHRVAEAEMPFHDAAEARWRSARSRRRPGPSGTGGSAGPRRVFGWPGGIAAAAGESVIEGGERMAAEGADYKVRAARSIGLLVCAPTGLPPTLPRRCRARRHHPRSPHVRRTTMIRLATFALAAACAATTLPAAAQFAKPEDAIKYRQSALFVMSQHFGRTGRHGQRPRALRRAAAAAANAEVVADMAKLPWAGFGAGTEGGKAKPEVWKEAPKFKEHRGQADRRDRQAAGGRQGRQHRCAQGPVRPDRRELQGLPRHLPRPLIRHCLPQ